MSTNSVFDSGRLLLSVELRKIETQYRSVIWIIVFAGLFGVIGGIAEGDEGLFVDAVFGTLAGFYLSLRAKISTLERRLSETDDALAILAAANRAESPLQPARPAFQQENEQFDNPLEAPSSETRQNANSFEVGQTGIPDRVEYVSPSVNETDEALDPSAAVSVDPWQETDQTSLTKPPGAAFIDAVWAKASSFFTAGNIVVKVGLIILFFGISFLIKYAHERHLLPIEFRLSAIACFGMGLLLIGWRLRAQKASYAMTLQGGAIGILFLTIFAAARRYHLMSLCASHGSLVLLSTFLLTWALANWLDSTQLCDAWVLASTAALPWMVILLLSRFGRSLRLTRFLFDKLRYAVG